jgi:leader peptidase (prepilin peptidase)/N-methyltransferase
VFNRKSLSRARGDDAGKPASGPAGDRGGDVRRVDVGDGIYVRVPGPQLAAAPAGAGGAVVVDPGVDSGVKWTVPLAAAPVAVALAAAALARHGATQQGWLAAGVLAVLAVLAAIDVRWRVLPNRIVLPATAAVLLWQGVFAFERAPEWIGAALGAAAFLALPSLIRRGAIGMGDVKLGALLGATLGAGVFDALLLGFLATAPVTHGLVVMRRGNVRGATLPLGPFLALGAAVVLLA